MVRTAIVVAAFAGLSTAAWGQDRLYAINFPGNLYELNTTTGAGTLVGFTGFDRLNAAAADASGMIYASRARSLTTTGDTNKSIRVDPATGIGTLVADHGTTYDLRGLAFVGSVLYGVRDASIDELVTIERSQATSQSSARPVVVISRVWRPAPAGSCMRWALPARAEPW